MGRFRIVLAVLATAAACQGDVTPEVEADAYLCFGGGLPSGAQESGEVEIGIGSDFEVLDPEQELALLAPRGQGNAMFMLHPRIRGLDPGRAGDNRHPDNPRTLLSAWNEDGERLDNESCGFSLPYTLDESAEADASDELYMLGYERPLRLAGSVTEDQIDNGRVLIRAEVLDHRGRYAAAEVWVVASWTSL
jgi:hypothetical protein